MLSLRCRILRLPVPRRRLRHLALAALAIVAVSARGAYPQAVPSPAQTGTTCFSSASRTQLDSLAVSAERLAADATTPSIAREAYREQAVRLRERLTEGDFRVGDQIKLRVDGDTSLQGTFSVLEGPVLALPNINPVALRGVLRSELAQHLTTELARYLRDPRVTVTPLVRVAVLGEVRAPGFYRVPAATTLDDLLMQAGGPTAAGSLASTTIRRGSEQLLSARDVSDAFASGATLDELNLSANDQIIVGQAKSFNSTTVLQPLALISGILIAALSLRHR